MEKQNLGSAKDLLTTAQQKTEEIYMESREKLVEAGWTIEETRSSEGWFSYLCR